MLIDNALFSVAQGHAFFAGTCGRFVSSAKTRGSPPPGVAPRYKFVRYHVEHSDDFTQQLRADATRAAEK